MFNERIQHIQLRSSDDCYAKDLVPAPNAFRLERLNRVLGFISGVASVSLLENIKQLEDHKGALNITWHDTPTLFQKRVVEHAWEIEGESPWSITHYVPCHLCHGSNQVEVKAEE